MRGHMPNRATPRELTTEQLSARAENYTMLAMDVAPSETRDTFERLAALYAGLATERKAEERVVRH